LKSHQAAAPFLNHLERASGCLHITMTMLHEVEVGFKLHPDVRSFNEEWSGIGNPVARRKLQNRL
jgi:hypothetical protein